jgi:hypothetical protein
MGDLGRGLTTGDTSFPHDLARKRSARAYQRVNTDDATRILMVPSASHVV